MLARPRFGVVSADEIHLLTADSVADLAGAALDGAMVPIAGAQLLPPVTPTKIVCVGRNYRSHAEEVGLPLGDVPSVFLKPLQTMVGHEGSVVLPDPAVSSHVEHEGEIALVVGKTARHVRREDWAHYIAGITVADDVTARDLQQAAPQLTRAKGFDPVCPLRPFLHMGFDPSHDIEISLSVNGLERQRSTSAAMIFSIPLLVEWLTSWTTLMPGDVVLTGSPGGTGRLQARDTVDVTVSGVGTLRHGVVSAPVVRDDPTTGADPG